MKKIVLGALAVTLCVSLAACGTSANNAAITSLGNQLDETANTISNMQTINPTDLNLSKSMLDTIATQDNNSAIYDNVINTQQTILNEEYYKTDILNKTAQIKNKLSGDIKLSKAQTTAIKDLTNNLTKYTNSVSYTRNEMNGTVKSIVSMKKNVEKNADKINAKLNRLACNSNSRSSYYENILHTLEQLDKCVNLNCTDKTNQNNNSSQNTNNQNNSNTVLKEENKIDYTEKLNEEKKGLTKNIDSYLPKTINNNEETNNNCPNCNQPYQNLNNNLYNNYNTQNGAIPYNSNMPINNPAYNGNVYNRYERFNPSRNTDTYGPSIRNIDTYGGNNEYGMNGYGLNGNMINNGYGYYGNGMYGNGGIYNSNNGNRMVNPTLEQDATLTNSETQLPEKRLENFEEVKEDNTDEKIEQNKNINTENTTTKIKTIEKVDQTINKSVNTENKIEPVQSNLIKKEKTVDKENDAKNQTERFELKDKENIKKDIINKAENKNLKNNEEINTKLNNNKAKTIESNTFKTANKDTFKGPKIRIVDARKSIDDKDEQDLPTIAHYQNENKTEKNSNDINNLKLFINCL